MCKKALRFTNSSIESRLIQMIQSSDKLIVVSMLRGKLKEDMALCIIKQLFLEKNTL